VINLILNSIAKNLILKTQQILITKDFKMSIVKKELKNHENLKENIFNRDLDETCKRRKK